MNFGYTLISLSQVT